MAEPRFPPSTPTTDELDPSDAEKTVASTDAGSTVAGSGGATVYDSGSAPSGSYVESNPTAEKHMGVVGDESELVEPAPLQPGGISTATIATIAFAVLVLLILLSWLF